MRKAFIAVTGAILLGVTTGCLDEVTGTRPLSMTMSVDAATPAVGDTVTFSFQVTGTGLSAVNIDFGDGETDAHTYFGSVEAAGFSTHAYAAAGSYVVRGEVIAAAGSTTDSVTVTVN